MAAAKKAIAGMEDMEVSEVLEAPKKKEADGWSKTEKIRIPKTDDGSPNYVIASVNGRVFKIKKGEQIDVPAPIAEVIQHSFDSKEAADLFMESKAN